MAKKVKEKFKKVKKKCKKVKEKVKKSDQNQETNKIKSQTCGKK